MDYIKGIIERLINEKSQKLIAFNKTLDKIKATTRIKVKKIINNKIFIEPTDN